MGPQRSRFFFAAFALLSLALASGQVKEGYFLSDAAGFPISPLAAPPRQGEAGAPEYYLQVEIAGARETRTLYRDGIAFERRIREPVAGREIREQLFREGLLAEESRFGAGGLILEEDFYETREGRAALREKRLYRYVNGRLGSVEAFDAADSLVGRLDYRYDASGRLAELRSSGSFGEGRSALLLDSAGPLSAWSAEGEGKLLRIERFDENGRPAVQELLREGALQQRISNRFGPDGELSSVLVEDLRAGTSRESSYKSGGILVLVVERRGQSETSRTSYVYDEAGRLSRESRRRGNELTEKSLWYSAEGRLEREETRIRGLLSRVIEYESENAWTELLYENGLIFVRLRYENGRKILEEFLEGGIVVRSKAYP